MSSRLNHTRRLRKLCQLSSLTSHPNSAIATRPDTSNLTAVRLAASCFAETKTPNSWTAAPQSWNCHRYDHDKRYSASTRNFSQSFHHQNDSEPTPTSASQHVRHLMRSVPHPVAIITSSDPQRSASKSESIIDRLRGATVSSFNTVCLDPVPIVSFNITRLSSTFHTLEHSAKFVVHLLNENEAAVDLATRFSRGNATNPFIGLFSHDQSSDWMSRQNRSTHSADLGDHPLLYLQSKQPPPIHFSLSCRYLPNKTVRVEDHVVVLGAVQDVWGYSEHSDPPSPPSERQCLSYVNGGYRRV